jgi:hypothetical protein
MIIGKAGHGKRGDNAIFDTKASFSKKPMAFTGHLSPRFAYGNWMS